MSKGEKILFCVLNWGLGHATRSEPLIRKLLAEGHSLELASDGNALAYLQSRFPELVCHTMPAYNIRYAGTARGTLLILLWQVPHALYIRHKEQAFTEALCARRGITRICNDGRFGAYARNIASVYITHQLCPQAGTRFLNRLAARAHARIMNRFTEIWVPDYPEPERRLAGLLSAPNPWLRRPVSYLGPLSRFGKVQMQPQRLAALAVLSGPEPQRSILEAILLREMAAYPQQAFGLVRGIKEIPADVPPNITVYGVAGPGLLRELAAVSGLFICRSGYSGIMDIHAMQLPSVLLVPTPGQGEQQYLGKYLAGRSGTEQVMQDTFSLAPYMNARGS